MTVPYPSQTPYPSPTPYQGQVPQYGQYGYTPAAPPVKSKALGQTAMIAAIVVFVLSLIASVAIGIAQGQYVADIGSDFSEAYDYGYSSVLSGGTYTTNLLLELLHIGLGTIFGTTALVMGIVATVTKRGRPQGIVAIAVAGAAPFISYIVFVVTLALFTSASFTG